MIDDTDRIIRVNRSVKPPSSAYPSWECELRHPELELTGPEEFELDRWTAKEPLYNHSTSSGVWGNVLYTHLEKNHLLHKFLGLSDLLAIQARGLSFYRGSWSRFMDDLYGWRSVVDDGVGDHWVPRLFVTKEGVHISWVDIRFWNVLDRMTCIAGVV